MDKILDFLKKHGVKLIGVVAGLFLLFVGVKYRADYLEEKQNRIDAQNKIAEMSEVIKEREDTWSRLSQQKDGLIDILKQRNDELAKSIEDLKENIFVLNQIVANFEPIKVIVRDENVNEEIKNPEDPPEEQRIKVSFNETVDPINVEGFTLTNPAEAELEVSFIRPLKLSTTIVQGEDGSWKTYVEGDWPNLEIENIETTVDPFVVEDDSSFLKNISIASNIFLSTELNDYYFSVGINYDVGRWYVGPAIGFGAIDNNSSLFLGLNVGVKPWE